MFCLFLVLGGVVVLQGQTVPASDERSLLAEGDDSSVQVTNLAAIVKERTKVLLNWRLARIEGAAFVAVERSVNGRDFEMVALLKQPVSGDWYEWVDDSPGKGRNAYRIKHAGKSGVDQHSLIASTLIAGDISFKFYPNPVDNILIIRSEHASDVQIIDARGVIRLSQSGFHGLQTLNVSSLEKGVYILRVNNRVTGTISQEKLLKN
ncbi:putative secreted protein (Por secretion system target) [Pseudobacter ginsenosidimutans]|uniref:Putative secreted protein (Por secretion system target) n=2 Tax=Pseudobacter ginsenosidimutans TaxID=661488 RepID=A0A4Q7MV44_9BACT|nr:putative secreted protein (Por secretion system target) [Pseudobacter ginsenosidimutans]